VHPVEGVHHEEDAASKAHPRAASTLLEGLALWQQRPLGVVVCVDGQSDGHALGLYDALGLGRRTLHHEVGVAYHHARRRALSGAAFAGSSAPG
jgi:hypothetical protein